MFSVESIMHDHLKDYFKFNTVSLSSLKIISKNSLCELKKKPLLIQFYTLLELNDKVQDHLFNKGLSVEGIEVLEIADFCKKYAIDKLEFEFKKLTPKIVLYRNLINARIKQIHHFFYSDSIKFQNTASEVGTIKFIINALKHQKQFQISNKLLNKLKQIISSILNNCPDLYSQAKLEIKAGISITRSRKAFLNNIVKLGFKTCLCCGEKRKLTFDHVIAQKNLSNSSINKFNINCGLNAQWLCVSCNSSKGSNNTDFRSLDHYIAVVNAYNKKLHDALIESFLYPDVAAYILVKKIFYKESNQLIFTDTKKYSLFKSPSSIIYYTKKLQEVIRAKQLILL